MVNEITLIGILEDRNISEGVTNEKAWKRYVLKINGITLSTFDSECEDIPLNSTVKVEYVVEGQYNNIKHIEISKETPTIMPASDIKTTTPPRTSTNLDTETSIVSQVIIKAVAEMVSSGKIDMGKYKENALALVDIYKESKKKLLE